LGVRIDALLVILKQLHSDDQPEDVAVWKDDRQIVAVMLAGQVHRFDDRPPLTDPPTPPTVELAKAKILRMRPLSGSKGGTP
jgi:hypothetical protein